MLVVASAQRFAAGMTLAKLRCMLLLRAAAVKPSTWSVCTCPLSRLSTVLMLQVAERVNNLEALDGMRRTALISAAVANQADTVEVLTAAGSDLDAQVSLPLCHPLC